MKFKVLRIEKWDDPRDQKFELMEGGLFGSLSKEFEPILVAVINEDPKTAIRLDAVRKALDLKKMVEIIPFDKNQLKVHLKELQCLIDFIITIII